jgi:hypothetical protein
VEIEKSPIYFAAELAPTDKIPPEAPLCYKFMVAGPEEQLKKLQGKYPDLYDYRIVANAEGGKNLVAKRRDAAGQEIAYFYSTSPAVCNHYQQARLGTQAISPEAGGGDAAGLRSSSPSSVGQSSLGQRYRFLGNDQGIVEDTLTKLQWQRCSLGQTWNGATCAGEAKQYTWDKAIRIAPAGWRLPRKDELASLVYCSSGKPAYWKPASGGCQGAYSKPTIWSVAYPNTPEGWFWSSSPSADFADGAWYVDFGSGYVYDSGKGYAEYVRLVRGGQ